MLVIWMHFYLSSLKVQIHICYTFAQIFLSLWPNKPHVCIWTNIHLYTPILFKCPSYTKESPFIIIMSTNSHMLYICTNGFLPLSWSMQIALYLRKYLLVQTSFVLKEQDASYMKQSSFIIVKNANAHSLYICTNDSLSCAGHVTCSIFTPIFTPENGFMK